MLNYFNFKEFTPEHLLLTNDFGAYAFVTRKELQQMLSHRVEEGSALHSMLRANGFLLPDTNAQILEETVDRYRHAKNYLMAATGLHIFVLTNACNLGCLYCQARDHKRVVPGKMDIATATRAVEIALQSPEPQLSFEFQGGEPLLNFPVLKHIVEYAEAHKGSHQITYSVVTNLLLLTDEILEFFKKYDVRVSTSLDGDQLVHDYNRPSHSGAGSYEAVVAAIRRLQAQNIPVGAIQTTTRLSLNYPKQIVQAYADLGFSSIFIRPLTKLGTALENWDTIGYTAEEFITFYRACLKYILELNAKGISMAEGHAGIFLAKILGGRGQNYMELRSPCGASIGQVAYYFDGNVYTCDEGRMVAEMGDAAFKLGNVFENTYDQLMGSPVCKTVCLASTLESLPGCAQCVYQPYCGVCPVVNYAHAHNVFGRDAQGYRCQLYRGMLDTLFGILYRDTPAEVAVLKQWQ